MPVIIKQYRDLDLDFQPHPIKGDIIPLKNIDAVKRSVRNLCLTNNYERPYQPSLGAGLAGMLFENIDAVTAIQLKTKIIDTLARYENRAKDIAVEVSAEPDNNGYLTTIQFSVDTQIQPITIQVFLERAR